MLFLTDFDNRTVTKINSDILTRKLAQNGSIDSSIISFYLIWTETDLESHVEPN